MDKTEKSSPNEEIKKEIESISDQLCFAVKGEFDFFVEIHSVDESIQKLGMLINFVLDTVRRSFSEITEKNSRLTELDKLKSDFLANISHELRTPLTLILGPLESILKDDSLSLPPKQQENLQRMHRNAHRLYVLVNDLLDFSKAEAGKLEIHEELIDMKAFIAQIIDDAQGIAEERKLTLTFAAKSHLGLLLFDQKMIEKIVLNLISNAMKFTPEGGKVDVRLEKEDNFITLSVADTGNGIPEADIQRLFERFHQVNSSQTRAHEGTGIGLAIIHQFVDLMGGKITVESKEGKGSTFTVRLPAREPSADDKVNTQHKESKQYSSPIKTSLVHMGKKSVPSDQIVSLTNERPLVLITDDNPDMRAYIASLLENSYEVIAAENGKEALEAVYKYHPQVILSDVMMPVMDGYQLTQALKADPQTANIPIILITAKAGKESIVSGIDIGADDYIPKPFSAAELLARVRAALRLFQSHATLKNANDELTKEIEERKKLELANAALNDELILAARRAGMADISTSILHNVGNVLNSVSVSLELLKESMDNSHINKLMNIGKLFNENISNISSYLTQDSKGKLIPQYLVALSQNVEKEFKISGEEIENLRNYIQHVKEIIATQNSLSSTSGLKENISLPNLIETALKMTGSTNEINNVIINKVYSFDKSVLVDKSKFTQILVNLLQNAKESILSDDNNHKKEIAISIEESCENNQFKVVVTDTGSGILPENITKIFSFGFSTKENGHGFGLHASALAAKEMGGQLIAQSQGKGKGATFILTLPSQNNKKKKLNSRDIV